MRLVNNYAEIPSPMLIPYFIKDERKFLNRRDNDLLPTLDELAQVTRMYRMPDCRTDLSELFYSRFRFAGRGCAGR